VLVVEHDEPSSGPPITSSTWAGAARRAAACCSAGRPTRSSACRAARAPPATFSRATPGTPFPRPAGPVPATWRSWARASTTCAASGSCSAWAPSMS
jgi:hypothetical protein